MVAGAATFCPRIAGASSLFHTAPGGAAVLST